MLGEHLERHFAVELGIGGQIDLAHAALADEGGDAVVAESGADLKGHRLLGQDRRSFYIWMVGGSSGCTELPPARPQDPSRSVRRAIDPSPPNHAARIGSALATMTDMSKTSVLLFVATTLMLTWGCGSSGQGDLAPGAEITIEMPDGSFVTGRVAQPAADGKSLATVEKVAEGAVSRAAVAPKPVRTEPRYAEVTVPAGTTLALMLDSALASDVSQVEDPVRARLERPVMVDGMHAIPQGSKAYGTVTTVDASGKVQGRARLAFRFDQLDIAGDRYEIRSDTVSYTADSTKSKDAKKIGIGAGAGALIGGLLGGKKGAGTGAAIGGGGRERPWC